MSRPKAVPADEGSKRAHKVKRSGQPVPDSSIAPQPKPPSPAERLDAMTRERIDSLEVDKDRLHQRIEHLQAEVIRITPENAQLREALKNAEANNLVSTILIVVGGGIISYATFTGNVGRRVADVGGGALLAGAFLLFTANVRRWLGKS